MGDVNGPRESLSMIDPLFFFFQAEDGIRDVAVTGVQTCALPIYSVVNGFSRRYEAPAFSAALSRCVSAKAVTSTTGARTSSLRKIGRASCRERVLCLVLVVSLIMASILTVSAAMVRHHVMLRVST